MKRESPNGETCIEENRCILNKTKYVKKGKPVNWNILVTGGEENKWMIPRVAASEIGGA